MVFRIDQPSSRAYPSHMGVETIIGALEVDSHQLFIAILCSAYEVVLFLIFTLQIRMKENNSFNNYLIAPLALILREPHWRETHFVLFNKLYFIKRNVEMSNFASILNLLFYKFFSLGHVQIGL
ncbi:hypothetical protein ACJX0J_021919, partial [Zea mays]